jgi:hypothetical protein
MSNEQAKYLNSKRRHKTDVAIARQLKIAKRSHIPGTIDSPSVKQPHRLAKHRAMDCGNPQCFMCGNPRRTHKDRLTNQEKRMLQDIETVRDRHSNGVDNGTADE